MRAIVTGGAGFIGFHLCSRLLRDNRNAVVVFDNFSTGKTENLLPGSVVEMRHVEAPFSRDAWSWEDIDTVFHLAAETSVHKSLVNPMHAMLTNVGATLNMLELCRKNYVKNFVYVSSAAVYGNPRHEHPITENDPILPISPYGISKYTGESVCRFYMNTYGLKTAIIRPFNVYGPRQDPLSEYAAVIPRFIARTLDREQPIIYGDGNQVRDFIYVGDVVDAIILSAGHSGTWNVGSGVGTTINTLASIITEMAGMECKPIYDLPRSGDIKYSVSDINSIKNSLMFDPKTDLKKGLFLTYEWFRGSV